MKDESMLNSVDAQDINELHLPACSQTLQAQVDSKPQLVAATAHSSNGKSAGSAIKDPTLAPTPAIKIDNYEDADVQIIQHICGPAAAVPAPQQTAEQIKAAREFHLRRHALFAVMLVESMKRQAAFNEVQRLANPDPRQQLVPASSLTAKPKSEPAVVTIDDDEEIQVIEHKAAAPPKPLVAPSVPTPLSQPVIPIFTREHESILVQSMRNAMAQQQMVATPQPVQTRRRIDFGEVITIDDDSNDKVPVDMNPAGSGTALPQSTKAPRLPTPIRPGLSQRLPAIMRSGSLPCSHCFC